MILSSGWETFENIYVVVVLIIIVAIIIFAQMKKSKYMKEQKETGTDKKKLMDAMQKLMGDRFPDYTYVVGYYTKSENHGGRVTTYYYYPYILAFTSTELVILPFLVKEGELIVRNRLDVDWKETELNSTENSKGTKLHIYLGGEMMIINVDKVIKSNGVEKSERPLAIYQEQEVERFISTLPQLKSLAKKK